MNDIRRSSSLSLTPSSSSSLQKRITQIIVPSSSTASNQQQTQTVAKHPHQQRHVADYSSDSEDRIQTESHHPMRRRSLTGFITSTNASKPVDKPTKNDDNYGNENLSSMDNQQLRRSTRRKSLDGMDSLKQSSSSSSAVRESISSSKNALKDLNPSDVNTGSKLHIRSSIGGRPMGMSCNNNVSKTEKKLSTSTVKTLASQKSIGVPSSSISNEKIQVVEQSSLLEQHRSTRRRSLLSTNAPPTMQLKPISTIATTSTATATSSSMTNIQRISSNGEGKVAQTLIENPVQLKTESLISTRNRRKSLDLGERCMTQLRNINSNQNNGNDSNPSIEKTAIAKLNINNIDAQTTIQPLLPRKRMIEQITKPQKNERADVEEKNDGSDNEEKNNNDEDDVDDKEKKEKYNQAKKLIKKARVYEADGSMQDALRLFKEAFVLLPQNTKLAKRIEKIESEIASSSSSKHEHSLSQASPTIETISNEQPFQTMQQQQGEEEGNIISIPKEPEVNGVGNKLISKVKKEIVSTIPSYLGELLIDALSCFLKVEQRNLDIFGVDDRESNTNGKKIQMCHYDISALTPPGCLDYENMEPIIHIDFAVDCIVASIQAINALKQFLQESPYMTKSAIETFLSALTQVGKNLGANYAKAAKFFECSLLLSLEMKCNCNNSIQTTENELCTKTTAVSLKLRLGQLLDAGIRHCLRKVFNPPPRPRRSIPLTFGPNGERQPRPEEIYNNYSDPFASERICMVQNQTGSYKFNYEDLAAVVYCAFVEMATTKSVVDTHKTLMFGGSSSSSSGVEYKSFKAESLEELEIEEDKEEELLGQLSSFVESYIFLSSLFVENAEALDKMIEREKPSYDTLYKFIMTAKRNGCSDETHLSPICNIRRFRADLQVQEAFIAAIAAHVHDTRLQRSMRRSMLTSIAAAKKKQQNRRRSSLRPTFDGDIASLLNEDSNPPIKERPAVWSFPTLQVGMMYFDISDQSDTGVSYNMEGATTMHDGPNTPGKKRLLSCSRCNQQVQVDITDDILSMDFILCQDCIQTQEEQQRIETMMNEIHEAI